MSRTATHRVWASTQGQVLVLEALLELLQRKCINPSEIGKEADNSCSVAMVELKMPFVIVQHLLVRGHPWASAATQDETVSEHSVCGAQLTQPEDAHA